MTVNMTGIGLLSITILTFVLMALLDIKVYHESFGTAFFRLSYGFNDNWKAYLLLAGAFIIALISDLRRNSRKRSLRKKHTTDTTTDTNRIKP
ncbi:hypothetical protein [Paenibacillus sp. SI8]|uniref:hypothetical protein n=1 Tax=unclassified Paenibacillus TaxID=185978 RepID=UPI003466073D